MTYDAVVKTLQTMLEIPLNQEDENFRRILPRIFEYAENRIYRELDFLATTTTTTGTLTANNREIALPSSVLVLRQVTVIATISRPFAPGGVVTPFVKRNVLERVSPEALDMFWPEDTLEPGVPRRYALIGKEMQPFDDVGGLPQKLGFILRFSPRPNKGYSAEYLGVLRPRTLSPTNTETLLSVTYPDLFCAACMVFASGYQRDFSAMADDPQKAMSWEGTYNALRQGTILESMRQKEGVVASMSPAAAGTP